MNLDEKWIVAVTAGRWQIAGIREAQNLGLKVIAIDENPFAEGFTLADITLCVALDDDKKVIEQLRATNRTICGVISFASEAGMNLAAIIRAEFGLPGADIETSLRLTDKKAQRTIWTQCNVAGPLWESFDSHFSALEGAKKFTYPYIVKPSNSSGSRGVTKIESETDNLATAVLRAFDFSSSGEILIEDFMVGTEFTVEIFANSGEINFLAVTEKKKVEGTGGTVSLELATPSRPENELDLLRNEVRKAFEAIGYLNGPGHAEIILMDNQTVGMVEVAGRGGGFMVFEGLVPAVCGVNVARLSILQAIGAPIEEMKLLNNSAVLRFFPSRPGVVVSVNGVDAANSLVGVQAEAFVSAGQRMTNAISDADRLGFVLATALDIETARNIADTAAALITFEIAGNGE